MKKLISILSAMVVLLSMTACGKNGDESKNTTTTTTTSITTSQSENEQPEIEPLPVPEGGWTAEELAKTIRINGELISIPFTIDSLGEGYTIKEEDTQIFDSGACGTHLYYNDEAILTAEYVDIQSFDQIISKEPWALNTYWEDSLDDYYNDALTFNGIHLGATVDEVEEVYGEANQKSDTLLTYVDKKTGEDCLFFRINDREEVYCVILILKFDVIKIK